MMGEQNYGDSKPLMIREVFKWNYGLLLPSIDLLAKSLLGTDSPDIESSLILNRKCIYKA
jgi:hypothetical protein